MPKKETAERRSLMSRIRTLCLKGRFLEGTVTRTRIGNSLRMTVTDKAGNKYVMGPMESISFPPNEGRGLKNESDKPAKMLVIINYPDA